MIKAIIFDLDGTLADTSRDIASAVNHIRTHFGLRPLTVHEVVKHVGRGVTRLIEKTVFEGVAASPDKIRGMIIKYYSEHLVDETVLYPGIQALLESLAEDYRLAVATNKPADLAIRSIKGLGIDKFFEMVVGPETAGTEKPDPAILRHIVSRLKIDADETIMVGDSPIDIETARAFGCRSCAVTWGYNTPQVLRESKPDFVIHSPADLLSYMGVVGNGTFWV